ncbi:MAG: transcription termination factor NusA [Eubacteriaceae bacterium]|jgi:N utilization substance protein A
MNAEFIGALDALQEEKNIDKQELIEAIESSIKSAYQKNYGEAQDTEVTLNPETGEISVYSARNVVETVENPTLEISLEEARKIDPNLDVGDVYRKTITPRDFGRIAAQNAKQMIVQKIKEAERNLIYDEFSERQDEILNGVVSRAERGLVHINVGSTEALLLPSEQVPGEIYRPGDRLKVYLLSIKKTSKGPQINVSRTHPGLVKRLFEQEVPEIYDGIVEIISISREPGSRTKIAVSTNDESVDPVGACVGQRGVRVQGIISEINDEKIDIIRYSDDINTYLTNALSPAKVIKIIPNKEERTALAVVDDYQLSLAIGKEGQNVRLAAKLTGWKIDIKSKTDYDRLTADNPDFDAAFMAEKDTRRKEVSLDDIPDVQIDDDLFDSEPEHTDDDDLFEEAADLDELFESSDDE